MTVEIVCVMHHCEVVQIEMVNVLSMICSIWNSYRPDDSVRARARCKFVLPEAGRFIYIFDQNISKFDPCDQFGIFKLITEFM